MKGWAWIGILVAGILIGYLVRFWVGCGLCLSDSATLYLVITLSGGFGGLLYTMRDNGLELPHKLEDAPYNIQLGWISDFAYGIAGAFVVFLLLPPEILKGNENPGELSFMSPLEIVKLLSFAIVGGYGGRSLVDQAAAAMKKDVREARKAAEEAKEGKDKLLKEREADAEAIQKGHLVFRLPWRGPGYGEVEKAHFRRLQERPGGNIPVGPQQAQGLSGRRRIKKRMVAPRRSRSRFRYMETVIPVFEALIENEAGEQYHRNYAELGLLRERRKIRSLRQTGVAAVVRIALQSHRAPGQGR